jgi:HEPN domain-containing protein
MADNLSWLIRDWLSKAAHDLQTARIVSATLDGPLDTAIYHCQQAAEKAVKGWLAWRGVAAAKTHDLIRLVAEAADGTPDFAQFEEAAEILTPYVSAFRYPGLTEDAVPSREEFDAALKHAQTIYDFVVNLLPAEARP